MSIKKPTSAYQYYIKQWTFMNEEDKAWYNETKEIVEKQSREAKLNTSNP